MGGVAAVSRPVSRRSWITGIVGRLRPSTGGEMAKRDQVRRRGSASARISVMGTGRVERAADIAHVTFVVEASRPTAAEARGAAAVTAAAVLEALAGAGVADADRRTA